MKEFQEFIASGTVKKQAQNKPRAFSLIEEAQKKKQFLKISLKAIPEKDMNPNFIVDSCYDIIMEMVRAKMLLDGWNAGTSHEAEVSYMQKLGFSEIDLRFMNDLRYYRNGTKYYGTILGTAYAEKALQYLHKMYPKLQQKVS